jgi:AcrR family transcriptional regulator
MAAETRSNILKNASKLVMDEGASKLTLADVAKNAGISKGGLLHHFGSKEELIRSMIRGALHDFARRIREYVESDGSPGSWLRGYIRATFLSSNTHNAAPLLAAIANDRAALEEYAVEQAKWSESVRADGLDTVEAEVIRLAADGLFYNEALGLRTLTAAERTKVIEHLLEMTKAPAKARSESVKGKRHSRLDFRWKGARRSR